MQSSLLGWYIEPRLHPERQQETIVAIAIQSSHSNRRYDFFFVTSNVYKLEFQQLLLTRQDEAQPQPTLTMWQAVLQLLLAVLIISPFESVAAAPFLAQKLAPKSAAVGVDDNLKWQRLEARLGCSRCGCDGGKLSPESDPCCSKFIHCK